MKKLIRSFSLSLLLVILFSAYVFGGANFSRIKTWVAGEALTASDLNSEFNNILVNLTPAGIDDESSNVAAMQATADPYPGGTESLATSLSGELQRIRYLIKQITGQAQWYVDPSGGLAPTGSLMPYAGSTAPTGWLLCYGQAVSRTTYAALFAVIGDTYGAGDGSTTFNLPDMRGRSAIGLDNMGGTAASRVAAATSLGQAAGTEAVDLTHTHTTSSHALDVAELPAHTHTITLSDGPGGPGSQAYRAENVGGGSSTTSSVGSGNAHNHGATGSSGSATQAIMNPYIGVSHIIKF